MGSLLEVSETHTHRQHMQKQRLMAALLPMCGTESQSRKMKPMPFPINQNFKRKGKAHFQTHIWFQLLLTARYICL